MKNSGVQQSTIEYFFLLEIGHLQKLTKQGRRKQTENRTLLGNCYCVISITGMEWRQRVRKVQTFWKLCGFDSEQITYLERYFTHTKPGSLVYKTVENTSFKRSDFYMYVALNQEDAAV